MEKADVAVETPFIAIITSTFPFGSAETFLHDELEALTALGCKPVVFPISPRSRHNPYADLDIESVRFEPLNPRTLYCAWQGLHLNTQSALRALATIVMSKSKLSTKLKNLVLFPTGLAVAYTIRTRRVKHIHAYWLSGPSTVAMIASAVTGIRWSYSAHSWDIFMEDNLIDEKTKAVSFARTISELGKQGILRRLKDAAGIRLQVVHLGVKVVATPNGANTSASSVLRLLCPASWIPVKGHRYLLQALRNAIDVGVDCHCVFAGHGRLRRELTKRIHDLRLGGAVFLAGFIPHETMMHQLHSGFYDAVILPSVELGNEFEGIPVSLMEAMAAGIPCIATRTGAVEELIDDSCGVLVNQRDPNALSEAIVALALSPARRRELGERGRQRVNAQFNAATSGRALLALMNDARQ